MTTMWYETLDELDAEQQRMEHQAFFCTFYKTPLGRQTLAKLRLIVQGWDPQGVSLQEKAVALIALDDLMGTIRLKAGVDDELTVIEAEADIAGRLKTFTAEPRPSIPGYRQEEEPGPSAGLARSEPDIEEERIT